MSKKLRTSSAKRKRAKKGASAESDDSIQCRLCGKWFRAITCSHLFYRHEGMTPSEYKEEFDLDKITSPETCELIAENNRKWTRTLVLREIRKRRNAGKPLNYKATLMRDRELLESAKFVLGSWRAAVEAAGLDYDRIKLPPPKWPRERVLEEILRRHREGLPLTSVGLSREKGGRGLPKAGIQIFGSWRNAIEAAGLDYDTITSRLLNWTRESVIAAVRKRHRTRQPLSHQAVCTDASLRVRSLCGAGRRLFGSWRNAVTAAGLDYDKIAIQRYRSHEEVTATIRRRRNDGLPLHSGALSNSLDAEERSLCKAGRRRFGSWKKAIEAAGLDYDDVLRDPRWTRNSIIACIRERRKRGVTLDASAMRKSFSPTVRKLPDVGRRHFGSWRKAIKAARLDH